MTWWITYPAILALLIVAELFYFRVADRLNIIDKPNLRSSHPYHAQGRWRHLPHRGVAVCRVLRTALSVVHGGADGYLRRELCG